MFEGGILSVLGVRVLWLGLTLVMQIEVDKVGLRKVERLVPAVAAVCHWETGVVAARGCVCRQRGDGSMRYGHSKVRFDWASPSNSRFVVSSGQSVSQSVGTVCSDSNDNDEVDKGLNNKNNDVGASTNSLGVSFAARLFAFLPFSHSLSLSVSLLLAPASFASPFRPISLSVFPLFPIYPPRSLILSRLWLGLGVRTAHTISLC